MNPSSKDIAELLDGESSLGLTSTTDLFYSYMPDDPDNCVAVIDNGGGEPMLQFDKDKSDFYNPSISVQVRNTDYDDGYAIIFAIYVFLHATGQTVINGTLYGLIKAISDPQLLHQDEHRRWVLVVNFEIKRRSDQ